MKLKISSFPKGNSQSQRKLEERDITKTIEGNHVLKKNRMRSQERVGGEDIYVGCGNDKLTVPLSLDTESPKHLQAAMCVLGQLKTALFRKELRFSVVSETCPLLQHFPKQAITASIAFASRRNRAPCPAGPASRSCLQVVRLGRRT